MALDGVEDPRNLGAILRSVEAAGADGALLPERHSAGLSEVVGRASAGALEHVRVARVGNLVQAIETLKARGVWVVGFDSAGTERWDAVDLTRPVCLVLGGEGRGIRRLVREHCDHLVSIPHFGHVSSLNVSVAAGIALYEAVRQRGTVPSAVRPIPAAGRPETRVVGPLAGRPRERSRGRAGRAPSTRVVDDEPAEDDEHGPETLPAHVDIHGEDVAWGQGPTVLKPVGSRRGRRPTDRRRRPRRPTAVRRGRPARREGRGGDGKARERKAAEGPAGRRRATAQDPGQPGRGEPGASAKRGRRRRRKRPGGTRAGGGGAQPRASRRKRRRTRRRRRRHAAERRPEAPNRQAGDGDTGAPASARATSRPAPPAVAPEPGARHPACIRSRALLDFPFVAGVAQR